MAAGLGFKDFQTGEVLTAADVDGYLMQGIWVFASTAARDAAVTAPQEGNFAFTKDTNSLWYYDGAAWVASGATGDIEGVTAGIGISGGGTSGTVTVTNSMATAIDAKGDLVAGTGADTFAKLTVGANDTILTADSTAATGLKWAAPASGGGMTLLSTTTLSGASTTISSISQSYNSLFIVATLVNLSTSHRFRLAPNAATTSSTGAYTSSDNSGNPESQIYADEYIQFTPRNFLAGSNTTNSWALTINNYTSTASHKPFEFTGSFIDDTSRKAPVMGGGSFRSNTEITSLEFSPSFGTFSGGTILVYGVK
jgi:hypothetical protein